MVCEVALQLFLGLYTYQWYTGFLPRLCAGFSISTVFSHSMHAMLSNGDHLLAMCCWLA